MRLLSEREAAEQDLHDRMERAGITQEAVILKGTAHYRVRSGENVSDHATPQAAREAVQAHLEAAGLGDPAAAPPARDSAYGAANRLITRARYEASRARLQAAERETAEGTRMFSGGLNPEQFDHALAAGLFHLEAKARSFVDWSAEMVRDFGEHIRPHLEDLYARLYEAPAVAHLRKEMTPPEHSTPPADPVPAPGWLGPQKIAAAPQAVPVPKVNIPRHRGGMVEALREWWATAKSGLANRLKEKAGEMIVNVDKLKQFKEGESALHHFQALAALPETYENSVQVFREADLKRDSGIIYEKRYAWVDFPDGNRRQAMFTVRLYPDPAMPRGLYSLEALGLEIHEAALTYMPVTDRGTDAGFDQADAGQHLSLFRSGIKPEHAFEAGKETSNEGTGRPPEYDVIDGTPEIPAGGPATTPPPGGPPRNAADPHPSPEQTARSVAEPVDADGARFAMPADEWMAGLTDPPPGLKADPDAPNSSLDHAFIYSGSARGELFEPDKLPILKKLLADHGVELNENATEELSRLGMAAAFAIGADNSVSMLIKDGASFREVMHELGHFATFRRKGSAAGYKSLTKAQREVEVYEKWMQNPEIWNRLNKEEKELENDNFKRYSKQLP